MEKSNLKQPVKRLRNDVVKRLEVQRINHVNISKESSVYPYYLNNRKENSLEVMLKWKNVLIPEHYCYISEYFMCEYTKWYKDSYVFINTGTGTGKTTFIEKLAQLGVYRILVLTNRKANRKQIENHLKNSNSNWNRLLVKVMSYQELEKDMDMTSDMLDLYDYIVCDESHYFLADSDFNSMTNLSLMKIMGTKCAIKLFMSATNQYIQLRIIDRLRRKYKNDLTVVQKVFTYTMKNNATKIRNIVGFESFERDLLQEVVSSDCKWVIFVKSIAQGKELLKKITKCLAEKDVIFLDRESVDEGTDEQKQTFDILIQEETFYQKVLICTCLLDNGVNIRSSQIRHIVCFDDDPVEIVQMIGRKRSIFSEDDFCDLYLVNESNQSLAVSLGNSYSKKQKFKSVKQDIEVYKELKPVHYLNTKEGIEYRNMSFYDPYVFGYRFNYLGFSKVYTEINNLNELRKAQNPFEVKVRWILDKLGGKISGNVLSSNELNAKRFLISINEIINQEFAYETRKDKVYFHSLISNYFWTWFKKENGERADRPMNLDKLLNKFMMYQIPLRFELNGNKIKIVEMKG